METLLGEFPAMESTAARVLYIDQSHAIMTKPVWFENVTMELAELQVI
jgi:hypothetical protein